MKRTAPIYELEVVLQESAPRIWRRLQVPGNATLGWLHAVIQVAMGWTNSHLHQFQVGGATYSDTRHHFAESEGDPEILEENKTTLQQTAPYEGATLLYEYDFGDSWQHLITVRTIKWPDVQPEEIAICTGGARACPPEDCGGIWGYDNLLTALRDPAHPDHDNMREWIGGGFDPQAFSARQTNNWLSKLKWPKVTEAQLRKVLLTRS